MIATDLREKKPVHLKILTENSPDIPAITLPSVLAISGTIRDL